MPRLWMVPPENLCRKHLVAEHHECHVFLGKLKAGHKLDGYIEHNLFSLEDLFWRHEALAFRLEWLGYEHKSPFAPRREVMALGAYLPAHGRIDREAAAKELYGRCPACNANRLLWEDPKHGRN